MPRTKSKFYNTIGETGEALTRSREMVENQETFILEIFRDGVKLTPLQVEDMLRNRGIPMLRSSVVRGLRNLVVQGQIVKSNEKVLERYGKLNHLWHLKEEIEVGQGKLFKNL